MQVEIMIDTDFSLFLYAAELLTLDFTTVLYIYCFVMSKKKASKTIMSLLSIEILYLIDFLF